MELKPETHELFSKKLFFVENCLSMIEQNILLDGFINFRSIMMFFLIPK